MPEDTPNPGEDLIKTVKEEPANKITESKQALSDLTSPKSKLRPGFVPILILIIFLLLVLGVAGYFLLARNKSNNQSSSKVPNATESNQPLIPKVGDQAKNNITGLGNSFETIFGSNTSIIHESNTGTVENPYKFYQYWGEENNRKLLEVNTMYTNIKSRTSYKDVTDSLLIQAKNAMNQYFSSNGFIKDDLMSSSKNDVEKIAYSNGQIYCLSSFEKNGITTVATFCGLESEDSLKFKEFQEVWKSYLSDDVLDFHLGIRARNNSYAVVNIETHKTNDSIPGGAIIYLKNTQNGWTEILTSGISEPASCSRLKDMGFPTDLDYCYPL